jgi:hypothetical protein
MKEYYEYINWYWPNYEDFKVVDYAFLGVEYKKENAHFQEN